MMAPRVVTAYFLCSAVSQIFTLQVHTNIYALNQVQQWFQNCQNVLRLPKPIWMQMNLVLVEMFTNVVRHAHELLPEDTPIDLELVYGNELLEIKIWDCGEYFDFEQMLQKRLLEAKNVRDYVNVDDIPTGGRGLVIAYQIMDDLNYEKVPDGRNCLRMQKRLRK
jgi:serine/threonine-protein kinase RsbW